MSLAQNHEFEAKKGVVSDGDALVSCVLHVAAFVRKGIASMDGATATCWGPHVKRTQSLQCKRCTTAVLAERGAFKRKSIGLVWKLLSTAHCVHHCLTSERNTRNVTSSPNKLLISIRFQDSTTHLHNTNTTTVSVLHKHKKTKSNNILWVRQRQLVRKNTYETWQYHVKVVISSVVDKKM